ncbi:MAG: HDOD domain-containing protein [Proteobacteria bacterium]|nr:HDOD domain-containing protein [Pseudomonadota bacterium]
MSARPADAVMRTGDLPALPAVALELIRSLGDEAAGSAALASTIACDPALVAKTLRLANSPFYGVSRTVDTVADAVAILGTRTLRGMASAASLMLGLAARCGPAFDQTAFWRHALGTALSAEALARVLGRDEELAFTLGLLHDIGRLALAAVAPASHAAVLEQQRRTDSPVLEAERAVLGTDHAALGALAAEHWRFAPRIVRAIAEHHAPPDDVAAWEADLLHVADNVAHALDLTHSADDQVPPLSLASWQRLALDERHCREAFAQVEARHESICAALLGDAAI